MSQEPPADHDAETATDTPEEPKRMQTDPWERNWMRFSTVFLSIFVVVLGVTAYAFGFQLPGAEVEHTDPDTVTEEGPFANPGVTEIEPGVYEVHVLAQMWAFTPATITVPVGSEVTFHGTAIDVQHGFKVAGTNVNMMLVPGHVSTLKATFDEVGSFPYICNEYCGISHHQMYGTIEVIDPDAEAADDVTAEASQEEGADAATQGATQEEGA